MAKKKNKKVTIGIIPKEMILDAVKPRFNAFQGGIGAFKDKTKYTRKKKHNKKEW